MKASTFARLSKAIAVDPSLRTLDAIHLASALLVTADEFFCYDTRLARAAEAAALVVATPS